MLLRYLISKSKNSLVAEPLDGGTGIIYSNKLETIISYIEQSIIRDLSTQNFAIVVKKPKAMKDFKDGKAKSHTFLARGKEIEISYVLK